ncbi:hypothetical protein A2291_06745 [candidate division WOR-1 bacterium RIFOXYB2_FULL_42_35]|uniref:HD domain-containing protein n=1 Tax=candidate division WOR-1 bacterium RIFOXYC2_FULL_41_25 TaxID=1802586 RepID=A0A1F4TPH9_UNCSA|nr:MAG: hypothetical protein A2291_06745 [candidate division WOR-1 bacterium RIFOXYB2_FULL_42_35]OGC24579.1 MAG: hypothetical protein A2247_06525 [candidate division WOR-1 bacterium RIFOXYA2_FULL_41_14]OGC34624.1 MAG: hypothetical protein A2462_04760 [candidate division WOR-1 bacterium RIFOXYC2_FULL_41_25]OGC42094.1 MAG: hypothetical protein A2548_04660 [candidate division WOR-1 bacterium RIFOXYD2_FULL_41_8]
MLVRKIYPGASVLALTSKASTLDILQKAVSELGKVLPRRAKHIRMVVQSQEALARRDVDFFFARLPQELKTQEQTKLGLSPAQYKHRFTEIMQYFFDKHKRLSEKHKELLELATWAHDLGVPLGIEQEHSLNGAKIIGKLIRDKSLANKIGSLILFHGLHAGLSCYFFPRDLYKLPQKLQPTLFLLDFCDATARIDFNNNPFNPIGLELMEYYLNISTPKGLKHLENPEKLLDLRLRYGFGFVIFQGKLSKEDKTTMFEEGKRQTVPLSPSELTTFYGSLFRSTFSNLLFPTLDSTQERAQAMIGIKQVYNQAHMQGEVVLWPDIDIGERFIADGGVNTFVSRYKEHIRQHGIATLLSAKPEKRTLLFMVSRLYPEKK